MLEKQEKALRKSISTSERRAEHPFAIQNTQQLSLFDFQGDELDDVDYRSVEDYGQEPEGGRPEDEDEDEKVLEELEDKQLLARIGAIEAENHSLKEQVLLDFFFNVM